MLSGLQQKLEGVLDDLVGLEDVEAAALVRRDGLVVVHRLPKGTDPKKIAAMAAAVVGTGEFASEALGQGRFLRSVITSDQGKIFSTEAGRETLLLVLVTREANTGFVLMALEQATGALLGALGSAGGD